jgi:hypothetical protein
MTMANITNSQERKYQHAIQAMIYNPDGISPEICHIYWFEKIDSLVVIPNFIMEIQSIDASILI